MTHTLLSHGQMCLVWSNVNIIFFWVSDTLCNTITHTLLSRLLSADWFRAGTMHAVTRTLRGGTEVFSHWRSLYSYFFIFYFWYFFVPLREIWVALPGYDTAASEQCYPFLSACVVFSWVQTTVNTACSIFFFFNVRTDVDACDYTWGWYARHRESALKVDSGRNLAAPGTRTCVSTVPGFSVGCSLHQLSYSCSVTSVWDSYLLTSGPGFALGGWGWGEIGVWGGGGCLLGWVWVQCAADAGWTLRFFSQSVFKADSPSSYPSPPLHHLNPRHDCAGLFSRMLRQLSYSRPVTSISESYVHMSNPAFALGLGWVGGWGGGRNATYLGECWGQCAADAGWTRRYFSQSVF